MHKIFNLQNKLIFTYFDKFSDIELIPNFLHRILQINTHLVSNLFYKRCSCLNLYIPSITNPKNKIIEKVKRNFIFLIFSRNT
jgi:hypothetical protein